MPPRPLIVGIGEILWDMLPGGKQLGGAPANFAYHAKALGADAAVVSRVGDDALGREILSRLDALGLDRSHVGTDPQHATGRVDVRLDAAGVPEYVIHAPAAWDFIPLDRALLDLAARADAVCFGSLALRAERSAEAISAFVEAARRGLRVFDVNLRPPFVDGAVIGRLLPASHVLKLNDAELPRVAMLLGIDGDAAAAIGALFERYSLQVVALTRGPGGSVLYARGGRVSDHPGFPATVADTVGAGDAFTAALVTGLLRGHDLDTINAAANRLAAYVCSQPGATPPIPREFFMATA
jgi:fructokinase